MTDDDRLLFPRELVLETIAGARRDITLHGQRSEHDIHLTGARVHMSSGGAAPGVFDINSGEYRESTTQDLYDAARIVDAMENIHHFSRSVVARDIEDNQVMDINTAYACLMGTAKQPDFQCRLFRQGKLEPRAQLRLPARLYRLWLNHLPGLCLSV